MPCATSKSSRSPEGNHLLNIGGFGTTKGVGNLGQDFITAPDQTYAVSFFFGRGNNDPAPTQHFSVRASIFDIISGSPYASTLRFINSGNAPGTGPVGSLTLVNFQFTATGNTSRFHR